MWQYYADLVNEKNHWLPPDNYQQEPLNVIAPRTSPTNIGFALLSVLGAFDLDFITENELYTRIENSLSVIESLPKWNGHLYNWYDIHTLKILSPKFVSTVDCGNYAVCLFVLEKGLRHQRNERADLIANRIKALLAATDFSLLYDEKKKLFPIGYNAEEDRMSSSFYDLYASEARLTSFYAIMKHQIPLEHWVQLARPTGQSRQDLILYSWSGTMFEYFMPHIFLPSYRRTLSGESLKGIVNAQMRYANKKIPWGISESCYYTFDPLLNYQYRAFGIPTAAARKDLSFSFVISPYSTFLAYPWFPSLAEENKKRLPKGKYGYFEAVDYRLGSENPRVVQCYMAHHIGMSFLSGVNVLKDRIMQKRFMEGEGEAYSALLAEQIPSYSTSFFLRPSDGKAQWESSQIRIDKPDPEHPRVKLLSNGALTEIVTDSGSGWLRSNHIDLTKYGSDPYAPSGIFLFIRNKGTLFGTTYAPLYQDYGYRMYFDRSSATCYGSFSDFETRMTVTMAPDAPVSVRELTVKNNQMTENTYEFFLCTEPTLCDQRAYSAHPEYKDLFLTAEFNPAIRTLSYCRKGEEEQWLSVTTSEPFRFDVRRDSFRDYSDVFACKCDGVSPYPIFPVILLRGAINVRGRGTGSIRFYFSASSTKQESISHLRKIVSQNIETLQRRYGQFYDSLCQAADIRSSDRLIFERIAPQLLFRVNKTALEEKAGNTLPLQELWRFGISGDFPIFTVRIGNDCVWRALPFIKALFLMIQAGIPADLILLYREEEGYQTPQKTALDALLSETEDSVRAHVFALNIHTMDEYLFIQKCSRTFINLERGWKLHNPNRTFRPIRIEGTPVPVEKYRLTLGRGGYGKNNSFVISKQGRQPLRPWCLVLANKKFGTVLTERSLGYTFAENASENRITPRIPGSGYQPSGERYYAVIRGKKYDLLRNASVEYYCNRAIYRINLFGCIITTEVFVPTHLSAKVINVSINTDCGFYPEIVFEPHIILGKEDLGTVTRFSEDNKIYYTNAFNGRYGNGHSVLFTLGGVVDGKALKFRPESEKSSASFVLGYGMGLNSARRLAEILSESGRIKKELKQISNEFGPHFKIKTPNKEFNEFCNGFLIQQILASRIYGRTGSQQPGGAYGFRDQLQDSLCLGILDSAYLKRQILRCCAHQFEAGDVLHWWHPRRNQRDDGIRTRFSDDPFWLVFACGEYFKITQDSSFFEKKVAYLTGEPLKASESDRYFTPQRSETKESVYHHALQALRFGMKIGQNGLIEIGAGDWNDGMNRVESGGETVWGSMFAVLCIESFLPLTESLGTREERKELEKFAESLRLALRKKAFSHGRYLRGFRGDSTPFGDEDSIDLIPQAFAQFCNLDKERTDSALALAYDRLWDEDLHLIKLLSPPYQPQNDGFPGSIADYPPGVRENGGQYTHAGVWFARALFRQGDTEKAWKILSGINPVSHAKTLHGASSYAAEPYVLAGDVYSLSQREGFGGWTHYTGAAGWYLKTVIEDLLGIERKGRLVTIRPHLPKDWNGCYAELQIETDLFRVRIERGTEVGCFEDGLRIESVLLNGTEHEIGIIV
ncbi:MAG: hypothetical protein J6B54_01155 [Clostridia bacterium]|nr:hypothetical protein [Clostridia bacterium]